MTEQHRAPMFRCVACKDAPWPDYLRHDTDDGPICEACWRRARCRACLGTGDDLNDAGGVHSCPECGGSGLKPS